jgi:hypothetical protein
VLNDFKLGIFLSEVEQRCHDAQIAADVLNSGLNQHRSGEVPIIWFGLRSILIAAASISQLTGGKKGPKVAERAELRRLLGIDNNSVLHNRAVRDAAEHVDDRIFRAYPPGAPEHFMGYILGPITVQGFLGPRFLYYDQVTGVVSFWESEVSIPEVLAEVRRILPLAQAAQRQPRHVARTER